jgi:hypothetical protein
MLGCAVLAACQGTAEMLQFVSTKPASEMLIAIDRILADFENQG